MAGHDAKYSFLPHPAKFMVESMQSQKKICRGSADLCLFGGCRPLLCSTCYRVVPTDFAPLSRWRRPNASAARAEQRSSMSGPQLVHLEMDEKDKESLQELQQGMAQAQQEQQMLQAKVQMRESERRRCDLTLHELADLPETARAYKQVGKMFLMQPLPELT